MSRIKDTTKKESKNGKGVSENNKNVTEKLKFIKQIKLNKKYKAEKEFTNNSKHPKILLFSIRNKIICSFLVPIVFMIVIGVCSYQKAAEGMNEKFTDSTKQTIQMAMEYVDMSCTFIEAEGVSFAYDKDLVKYFLGMSNASDSVTVVKGAKSKMNSLRVSNHFINDIHFVTKAGTTMISTAGMDSGLSDVTISTEGILDEYKEEVSGGSKTIAKWIDSHNTLDKALALDKEEYILVYEILAQTDSACIVIDIKADTIREFLQRLNLGEGSIVGFVTPNGREIICENLREDKESSLSEGESVFYGQEFYNLISEDNMFGAVEVEYKGEQYLFIYSRSEQTGATVCSLVPRDMITNQAEAIKTITVGLVILACVIVVLVCFFIVAGIQTNMHRISKKLGEVAKGDLTVHVKTKGHDEFKGLAGSANNMIDNTKKLVNKVTDATRKLEISSKEVGEVSDVINDYSVNITQAINGINEGMSRQAEHAQECVTKTDILSDEIKEVSQTVENVEKLVRETNEMINQGMKIIRILGGRAKETTDITIKVGESIDSLRNESTIINSFVQTITEISEQTNLLSLNASIEAARAGEAGRGFAVVAEEIRKLADDSAKAAGEISNNVEHIVAQTANSVDTAKQAQDMVALQSEAVEEVVLVFREMQARMNQLVEGLKEIVINTERADNERNDTLVAVRKISEIIDETAGSAETVSEIANRLLQNVENLNKTAGALGENMEDLKGEIEVFKI
ncbi:MAG: methyl-accepting chemotaxis protein [Lachnospiraceae bacterium]|nr:methyl-accepting chemotaxis protein [Lachnospiraceae bacterium]